MRALWLAGMVTLVLAGSAGADVWDVGTDNDNGNGTDNELTHGTVQVHDLGALPGPVADEDWYRLHVKPYSSWEVLVDGTTGDICDEFSDNAVELVVFDSDGTTGLYTGDGVSPFGCAQHVILGPDITSNPPPTTAKDFFVRVRAAGCTTDCNSNGQYTIRARETTLFAPRFNNSGGQVTVCLIQNGDSEGIGYARTEFFDSVGDFLYLDDAFLAPHELVVLNTSTIPELAGKGGSLVVTSAGGYGLLQGKCVAVEPATGFTFDTPMTTRPD